MHWHKKVKNNDALNLIIEDFEIKLGYQSLLKWSS